MCSHNIAHFACSPVDLGVVELEDYVVPPWPGKLDQNSGRDAL